jgi:hypothetical protein
MLVEYGSSSRGKCFACRRGYYLIFLNDDTDDEDEKEKTDF